MRHRRPGPYQVQAAIAALHARAKRAEDTDWAQIDLLYANLERLEPSPVVTLNRAVAVSKVKGPQAALDMIEERKAAKQRREFARADANMKPDPGRVTARRLNRAEYANAIRDLLALGLGEEDVLRLEVAVDDAEAVRVGHADAGLEDDVDRHRRRFAVEGTMRHV